MNTEQRVVDNRVFLLALDELYREAMKEHERNELLPCARRTARALSIAPANVPVEGYYAEDEELAEYFRIMRSLQRISKDRETTLKSVKGYKRLKQVTESRIFGTPVEGKSLLAVCDNPLSAALQSTFPDWTIDNLTRAAYEHALESDDFSLAALAALARDSVVLAALHESVVLYGKIVAGANRRQQPEYVWKVDAVIEIRANQFVTIFNELFDEALPAPISENAADFWRAGNKRRIWGRCVRLGFDDREQPIRYYHWAIDRNDAREDVAVDFWDSDIWTTARYRKEYGRGRGLS